MRCNAVGLVAVFSTVGLTVAAVPAAVAQGTVAAPPFAVVHDFPLGSFPGAFVQVRDGHFYVTSGFEVRRMTTAGVVTNVYPLDFDTVGGFPGNLVEGNDGHLYGATGNGGPADCGSVFRLTLAGEATPLHTFTQAEGHGSKTVIQGRDGNLYGTTLAGGMFDGGTIFRLTLDGAFQILHHFERFGPILTQPSAPQQLLQATDGNFYGVTSAGGVGHGSLFRMTPAGALTELHTFTGGAGGSTATGPLVQGFDGLYGTTASSTDTGGLAYRLRQDGTFSVLHAFDVATEGAQPGPLTRGTDGRFYGVTSTTVFQMTATGVVTLLHRFTPSTDGFLPTTGVLHAADGNFYGVNRSGGRFNTGTVFRLGNPAPCDNALRLHYSAGAADGMRFTLKTAGPSLWIAWLVSTTGVSTLWAIPVPAVSPAVSFDVASAAPPSSGALHVVTLLIGPGFESCGDWQSLR
jgi:uncharacterized repeat protein (TIGR03803 family)